MKDSFLQQLASWLLEKYEGKFDELVLILPSRRARIFLIEAFKQKVQKASWLPRILSMEDFIAEISDISLVDQLDLLFEFYQVYKKLEGSKADGIDEFMSWANVLLYDFNEIDRNLINAQELFSFLNATKALENWTPEGEDLTDYQKKYLNFWEKFHHYYLSLNELLDEKGIAYQGKLYKEAIDRIDQKGEELLNSKQYVFAGFNALTPAERQLIEKIKEHRELEMIWDADEYYMKDGSQEAGHFLRAAAEKSDEFNWIGNSLAQGEKQIRTYGLPGDVGQAKLLAELLDQNISSSEEIDPMDKAIILADENLLLPVLESLPEKVSPLNITMGYPVNQSSFYQFFLSYIQLFRKKEEEHASFYHKELFTFLESSILSLLFPENKQVVRSLRERNQLYYSRNNTIAVLPEELSFLFGKESLLQRIQELIDRLKNSGQLKDLELEILYHFHKLFNRLSEVNRQIPMNAEALNSIYRQHISKSSLSFVGEPLNGLQLMGVLESRTLDFKEVYICSLNEGILPSGKSQNSLIPFDIKKKFDLPTHREKDAIFSYHFYRILQRAEKVHLIYSSSMEGIKGAERSRFIEQLLYEMPIKNPKIDIQEVKVHSPQKTIENPKVVIEKDAAILQKIKEKIANGLSPSSINTYMSCPLDFYYKYILGLKEDERSDPEDGIEDSLFGTLLHDALEELYKEYEGELINESHLNQIEKGIQASLENAFRKNGIEDWTGGQLHLVFEVCLSYLKNFFSWEKKRAAVAPIHIIELEAEHHWEGQVQLQSGESIDLKLKGKVDRLEEYQGVKNVIDYKSGKVESKNLNAKTVEAILKKEDNQYGKQIQLMIYQLLYESESEDPSKYSAGIISFRSLNEGIWKMNELETGDAMELLSLLLSEMLDENIPFQHQTKSKYCKFCRDL